MVSLVLEYISLLLQIAAAGLAISLVKRTKFNASWILISIGLILMALSRAFELWPTIYPEMKTPMAITQRWLAFIISLVLLVGVFYIRKIFQFMRRLDRLRAETEQRVLAAVIRTEEQERQRFAKELHDGLGPLLSVIKMLVSGLDDAKSPEAHAKISHNLRLSVDEAISGVRNISANISPHILNNFGLRDAIEAFIKRITQGDAFRIHFSSNLDTRRFPYNTEVVLYRVVCELLNNTLRHAGASRVAISLDLLDPHTLCLTYSDNGVGFDPASLPPHGGMGLENIRHRLSSVAGDFQLTSAPGGGMSATATLRV